MPSRQISSVGSNSSGKKYVYAVSQLLSRGAHVRDLSTYKDNDQGQRRSVCIEQITLDDQVSPEMIWKQSKGIGFRENAPK